MSKLFSMLESCSHNFNMGNEKGVVTLYDQSGTKQIIFLSKVERIVDSPTGAAICYPGDSSILPLLDKDNFIEQEDKTFKRKF